MMRLIDPPSRILLKKNSGKLENPNLKNFQQSQIPQNQKECSIKEKIPYFPPIVIDNPKNVPQLLQTLSALTEEIVTGRMISSDKLKIFPPTSEAHRKIQRQITKDGLKSRTFELNDEKKIKIVIRGLNPDHDVSVIMQELARQTNWLTSTKAKSANTFNTQRHNCLTVVNWNAGGIKPKFNQFKYFAQEWKPDVIAIQETHLNPGDKLKLVNYTTYRTDRLTHRGARTALFIRNSIDHYPTPIASDSFENTTIAIILPNSQQITVSSIYRPPHGIISTDELNRIFNSNNKCIAVGDFNAKHSAWSLGRRNQNENIINDYICNNNLILLAPPEQTHFPHNGNNPSTLDFGVLKNFSSGDATSLNELCSDHNPVSFEIDINANIPAITKTLKTTNWKKFYDITNEAIPGNPSINSTKDIDEVINKITAVILTAINQSSKAKIINGPHRKLPPRITNKITLRNQIKKRWQITYDPRFKRKSTQLTNEIKADIN
ncbi:putative RNA-directed DNA polymerase from transposon X-element, partial [Araneus ventricosus]